MDSEKGYLQFLPDDSAEKLVEFIQNIITKKQIALIYTHSKTLKDCHELVQNGSNIFQYDVSDCKCLFHLNDKHKPNIIGINNINRFTPETICKVIKYYLNNGKYIIATGISDKIQTLLKLKNTCFKETFYNCII